jgi:stearoyl-CoA desaturase (delta-9 desaturase)
MTEDPLPFHDDPWWHKALTLTFVVVPLAVTVYAIVSLWGYGIGWLELALLVGGWGLTGMSISVGYHRMLTHGAFEAHPAVKAVLLSLGSMAVQGGAADWAATHKRHHAHADEEGDPHSPLKGFWHAHMGWLFTDRFVRSGPVYEELRSDPVVRWCDDHFIGLVTLGLLIPAAIGFAASGTLVGAWLALVWGGFVRIFVGHHITWSVNSLSHMFGSRPHDTEDEARNNPIVALLGFGEGWHNNHHAYPTSAEIGHAWWQLDPGRALIRILEKMGLVWNVHRPHEAEDPEATAAAEAAETAAS